MLGRTRVRAGGREGAQSSPGGWGGMGTAHQELQGSLSRAAMPLSKGTEMGGAGGAAQAEPGESPGIEMGLRGELRVQGLIAASGTGTAPRSWAGGV